ncbi:MAG: glycoside hydrolase family 2 TIM barrel-domain containing protein [Chitinophagaceae bacterium]
MTSKNSLTGFIVYILAICATNVSSHGSFLNNKYINLYGFSFHEDRASVGSAMTDQMLREDVGLIKESGANPSVICWGIVNELKLDYNDPIPFLQELNEDIRRLDSARYSACASFLPGSKFNAVSDLIAWNKILWLVREHVYRYGHLGRQKPPNDA